MDNQAGSATRPRRSGRATRQARKKDATQLDESDADTKVADPPKKRRRVAKTKAVPGGEDQAMAPKPRRRAGKLSDLLEMPIDILYEVFSQLGPFDILKLTRTSKDLRNLLLNKSAISVWRESLRSVPGLPDCPPDLSIPAYVNLLFSTHCHICLAYTRSVEWRFRMRICKHCAEDEIMTLYSLFPIVKDEISPFGGLDVNRLCEIIPNRTDKRGTSVYAQTMFQIVSDQYDLLEGEDAKKQFIEYRTALVNMIYQHARACETWERNRTDSRHQDLTALKEERLAAIVRRLEGLGWGYEVKNIRRPDSLADHKLVNKPQRLTDKVWSNIKSGILQFMEQMRVKRLEREFKTLIKRRKGPAIEAMREYKKSKLANGELLPGPPDYCEFEPILEILKKPVDIEITPPSFDPVIPLLPGLISQWRDKLDLAMAMQTGVKYWNSASAPRRRSIFDPFSFFDSDDDLHFPLPTREPQLSDAEAIQKLKLASAVFTCRNCSPLPNLGSGYVTRPMPTAQKIMFYPQVLAHQCNCINVHAWMFNFDLFVGHRVDSELDPSIVLGTSGSVARKQWDCKNILFHHQGKKAAEAVIKIADLDPAKATSQEMDDLKLRYVCTTCSGIEKEDKSSVEKTEPTKTEDLNVNIGLFDWRGAVRHHLDRHSDKEVKFFIMNPDEFSNEVKVAEEKLRERTTEEWQCVHCMDTRNEKRPNNVQAIKEHLLTEHEIDNPVLDDDYFRHLRAPDLHLFQRPLWVSYTVTDLRGELRLIPPCTKPIKGDDGAFVSNDDGTLKEEVVDHDKYDYARPRISDIDQYDASQFIEHSQSMEDIADYYESDSDMDMW